MIAQELVTRSDEFFVFGRSIKGGDDFALTMAAHESAVTNKHSLSVHPAQYLCVELLIILTWSSMA